VNVFVLVEQTRSAYTLVTATIHDLFILHPLSFLVLTTTNTYPQTLNFKH
jgi:hypothetical protein